MGQFRKYYALHDGRQFTSRHNMAMAVLKEVYHRWHNYYDSRWSRRRWAIQESRWFNEDYLGEAVV